MAKDLILCKRDLIENPTPRVPVCLVLDCSPSMSGETKNGSVTQQTNPRPIDELNEGVRLFYQTINEDEVARYAAEVAVVAFSDVVETVVDFGPIQQVDPPAVELEMEIGGTSIGKATIQGLSLLEKRKDEYKKAGVDYYQPWLVLMTDGQPTDNTHFDASGKISQQILDNKLTIFPIGIGDGADMDILAMFSPKRSPLKLRGLKFKEFFVWLSQSVSTVSNSTPGETVPLNTENIPGWAEL